MSEALLPPESLSRYADAIVSACLGIEQGDTLVVQGEPEHRELLVAVAESAYRSGAQYVDVLTLDPLVMRARLLHGTDDALGSGFGGTRSETPARGVNRSTIHLDVMIGSPELEATGFNARGRRIPLIHEGTWQI